MLIRVVDLETGGFAPPAGVCEAAFTEVTHDGQKFATGRMERTFLKPCTPMSSQAIAVHGIQPEEVANAIPDNKLSNFIHWDCPKVDYIAAHQWKFESQWIDARGARPICTLICAKKFLPGHRTYKNEDLFYNLGCGELVDLRLCMPAHRALPDTVMTAYILLELLKKATPEELADATGGKPVGSILQYGKFKGCRVDDEKEVNAHYLRWVYQESSLNMGNKLQAKEELIRRGLDPEEKENGRR